MYNNKILMTEEIKITENDLKDIEKKFNIKFPESFINHYLRYNGGRPEKDMVVDGKGELMPFTYFYAIKSDDGEDGIELKDILKTNFFDEDSIFPKWLVSFADDGIGGEYCWSLRKEEYGYIYYIDIESCVGDSIQEINDSAVFLSDSLEEFINSMVEDED